MMKNHENIQSKVNSPRRDWYFKNENITQKSLFYCNYYREELEKIFHLPNLRFLPELPADLTKSVNYSKMYHSVAIFI